MVEPRLNEARVMFAFAHDIRSYLRTILTRVQMVQSGVSVALLPEQDRLFLEEAASAAGEMNRLLSAMVAYFDIAPTDETTGLSLMLRGVLMDLKPAITEADATVSVLNELDVAAPKALHSVLKELLTNSCRFRRSDRKPEIGISTRMPQPQTLEVVVSDNGLGVEPEWLEKIFLPFQRLHSRSEFPGFGLGLALCHRIVTSYGGNISANASAAGGLSVVLNLPLIAP